MPAPYPKRDKPVDPNRQFGVRSAQAPAERVNWATNVHEKSVLTGEIAADAATVKKSATEAEFDFWDGGGYGPGSSSDPATRVQNVEVSLTEAGPGDGVILIHDYDLIINGGAFDWCSLIEETYRYGDSVSQPSVGDTTAGKVKLLRSRPWLQGGSASRVHAPGATLSGGGEIPILRSGITEDTLPAAVDSDYDATGYNYLFRIRTIASAELSGNNPFEVASSTGGRTFKTRDLNFVPFVLRITGG